MFSYTSENFVSVSSEKICSVNLDHETTFLALLLQPSTVSEKYAYLINILAKYTSLDNTCGRFEKMKLFENSSSRQHVLDKNLSFKKVHAMVENLFTCLAISGLPHSSIAPTSRVYKLKFLFCET